MLLSLSDLLLGGVCGVVGSLGVAGGVVVVVGGPIVVAGGGSGRLSEVVGCSLVAKWL